MNTIKIKDGTWHYWCASTFGGFHRRHSNQDICTYSRAVMWGAFLTFLLGCVAVAAFFFLVVLPFNTLFDILFGWSFGGVKTYNLGVMIFWVEVIVGAVIGIACFVEHVKQKRRERAYAIEEGLIPRPPPPPPSFIVEWYKSWKGKYCAKVEIV